MATYGEITPVALESHATEQQSHDTALGEASLPAEHGKIEILTVAIPRQPELVVASSPASSDEPQAVVKTRPRRSNPQSLSEAILSALSRDRPLNLADIAESVIKNGYKTENQNLAQAVYNTLQTFVQRHFVTRNNAKEYALLVSRDSIPPEDIAIVAARQEREKVERKQEKLEKERRRAEKRELKQRQRDEDARKRTEDLLTIDAAFTQAANLLTPILHSLDGLTNDERLSATITLSLERQLEFPSKNQRRGAPLL
ncbi:MAG: hypothetical protein ACLQNE_27775 [Thermoguttaceae bacterium]